MVDQEYLFKSISKLKIEVLFEEFVWNKMDLSIPFGFQIWGYKLIFIQEFFGIEDTFLWFWILNVKKLTSLKKNSWREKFDCTQY